jgi:hypothetical protein
MGTMPNQDRWGISRSFKLAHMSRDVMPLRKVPTGGDSHSAAIVAATMAPPA